MSYALLIDDDADLTASIKSIAESEGLTLATSSSWDDGLAQFHALSPDLVIADYNLPGSRHGLRLLFEISRARPSVHLVLISAYLNDSDLQRVAALGLVDRVLRKIDPMSTARAVLGEIREARDNAEKSTDWSEFASANRRVTAVSDTDLERLDTFLRSNRLLNGQQDGAAEP